MYDAIADPYCYPETTILKNIPDIKDQGTLAAYEVALTTQRTDEGIPTGKLDVNHYQRIHRHLFQDVYLWAGQFRTVRTSKDGHSFCYPEHIETSLNDLFENLRREDYFCNLHTEAFAQKAGTFLSTLNAIHPFREGNGRTQNIFLILIAENASHPLDLERLNPEAFLQAMINSFDGENDTLISEMRKLIQ